MKLLILSSSTGGGHDMRAKALLSWWQDYGNQGSICRPLDEGFFAYRMGTQFYNFIQVRMPWFHHFYFRFLEYANLHRKSGLILGVSNFKQNLRQVRPDLILSVHAHLNHGFFDLAKQLSPKPLKSVVFCGELADGPGFSRHWINPSANLFAGSTEQTCQAAVRRGMPYEKVENCGLLLRSPFYGQPEERRRLSCLRTLKIDSESSFLLLATGANGANRHLEVCRSLAENGKEIQVVALCGKNMVLKKKLTDFGQSRGLRILALPQMGGEEMFHLLHSASCLFGRPGAGLTSEALACGTPMIFDLSGGVMPQEINNMNFWNSRVEEVLSLKNAEDLPNLLERRIPSIKMDLPPKPEKLIGLLDKLVQNDD